MENKKDKKQNQHTDNMADPILEKYGVLPDGTSTNSGSSLSNLIFH